MLIVWIETFGQVKFELVRHPLRSLNVFSSWIEKKEKKCTQLHTSPDLKQPISFVYIMKWRRLCKTKTKYYDQNYCAN